MSERWQGRLPIIILCAAVAILFYRLFLGEVIFWGVPLLQFYPWREMAFNALRGGRLPVWNPLLGGGTPLLANYQTAIFYPPNWLYLIIPTEYAMGWVGVLHLVWAGLGMMAYLRRLGVDRLGQGVGGLALALSGYLVGRFGFLSITSTAPWLPWLMWAVDGVMIEKHPKGIWRATSLLAAITAMLLLAGHAQTGFYSLVLAGVYALWRAIQTRRELPRPAARLAISVAAMMGGFALAAIQLAPTFELMRVSQRASGFEEASRFTYSFWPWRVLTLAAPNLFGSPASGDYWGYGAYWEDATYVGLLTLVMSGQAILRWLRELREGDVSPGGRVVPFYLVSLPPVFILALGNNTPIFPWLFEHVPSFNLFQAPTRWSILMVFALCALGGIGIDRWQSSERNLYWTRLGTVGGVALTGIAILLTTVAGIETKPSLGRAVIQLGITASLVGVLGLLLPQIERRPRWRPWWEGLALALLATDLVVSHWGLNPTIKAAYYHQGSALAETLSGSIEGYRTFYLPADEYQAKFEVFIDLSDFRAADREHWDTVRDSLLPNLGMLDGIASANNFDPLLVGDYNDLLESLEGTSPDTQLAILQRMNVAVLLTPSVRPDLALIGQAGPIKAYRVPDPWPRAVLATCNSDGWCERLEEGETGIAWEQETELGIQVLAPEAASLVAADTFYPGWQAALDGQPIPIRRVNGAFRAVEVPAGEHLVRFSYRPMSLWIGAAISGLALIGWGGLSYLLRRSGQ